MLGTWAHLTLDSKFEHRAAVYCIEISHRCTEKSNSDYRAQVRCGTLHQQKGSRKHLNKEYSLEVENILVYG